MKHEFRPEVLLNNDLIITLKYEIFVSGSNSIVDTTLLCCSLVDNNRVCPRLHAPADKNLSARSQIIYPTAAR